MCNHDLNIDHRRWSEKEVSSLEGTKLKKKKIWESVCKCSNDKKQPGGENFMGNASFDHNLFHLGIFKVSNFKEWHFGLSSFTKNHIFNVCISHHHKYKNRTTSQ